MQYFIDGSAWLVWRDIQKFAESIECDLWPTEQSDNSFGMGRELRVNIVRRGDKPPSGQLAVTQQEQGTQLLVTDQPYSQRQGADFDKAAFTDFRDSLLLHLRSKGRRIKPISPDPVT